ncbi:MAG: hypothetical protein GX930_00495 [Clostridia bacterium]|jgi:predicted  nucleic acid-binding Zn-ribbon protein|nr:hypothetical protein [Clostridia bacterium]
MNIEMLYLLQELEAREAEVNKKLKKPPQVSQLKIIKEKFETEQRKLTEKNVGLKDTLRQLKKLKNRVVDLEAIEKELTGALYDGSVQNPKELENLQQKLDDAKEQNDVLSNEIITLMVQKDDLENEAKEISAALKVMYREFNQLKGQYSRIKIELEQELAVVIEDKNKLISQIDQKWLSWFIERREKYAGTPVGKITECHFCSGCRTVVPTAVVRHARFQDGDVFCEQCGRLLFAPKIS